ncbi:metallophosphoesterase [Lentibacillus sp. CBA3610]|uniref:metallophosphoesterase n=1 Tax=Lentibacillus sp. CBA3610 TaxID=2518176 RepID=UPI0020D21453|nr:metallophosphoesterase [Lentibacillus sp. CBA3610]
MRKLFAFFTFLSFIVTCFVKLYQDTHYFKLENVTFRSSKLPANAKFTILQISDLHNHVFGADNDRLISTVKMARPDLIVITGDLIDRRTKTFDHVFSLVERLTAINPHVLFVSGNHEWGNGRSAEFLNGLEERNITILNNRNTQFTKGTVTLNIGVG